MILGIPIYSWADYSPQIGDELAVFDQSGLLVGSQIFEGDNMAITIWGNDDQTTEKDGMYNAESFHLKLWSNSLNKEFDLYIESFVEGDQIYISNGISIVNNITTLCPIIKSNKLIYNLDILGRVINPINNRNIGFDIYDDGTVNRRF